jgi:zinc D-Ala-D-Ala carboxypeptidase
MQNVSEHISYIDAIRSDTAKRNGINNYFTPSQLVNMKLLAEKVYEPLVKHFGKTIYISSFFRNTKVNNPTNEDIFNYIKDNLDFDQLIIEDLRPDGGVGWIHVSYKEVGNRKQVLTMVLVNGKKHYEIYK